MVGSLVLVPFIFFLGLSVGSFLNVVIMRTLSNEQFVWGRSHCDSCGRDLKWFELIPLFSYLFLRGKCRTCQAEISPMHPVVELLTASLFVWWFLIGFAFFQLTTQPLSVIQPAFWLSVGLIFLIIVISDLEAMIIPDWTILALGLGTLLYRVILVGAGIYNPLDLSRALGGAALMLAAFLFLWFITKKQGMGFGDVKLVFPLALLLGWPHLLVGVFLAFLIGAVVGVLLLFMQKAKTGIPIPFAPFLILGTCITLIFGDALLQWYHGLLLL